METAWDWLTVLLFGFIAALYLQRSSLPPPRSDRSIDYLPPVLGCAFANWLGNEGHQIAAAAVLAGAVLYVGLRLHPLRWS